MPASSKAQQRFFGVVKAMQKGDIPKTGKAGKIAKTMSKKDVDDFASTKHKGKPEKVKREMKVRNLIKKMVREELAKMNEGTCGNGENGQIGEEPEGPHLIKKKKIKEGFDLKKLEIVIKSIQKKIAKQGRVTNARDEEHLKQLIKVYKDMGGRKIKEGKLTESQRVAKTILQQLGGNKFIAMTGAKNLGHTNKGLQMKIGKNAKGITHVIINLKASDTYEMEFIKLRGSSRKVIKKVKGVYNDMLQKIFTKYTGMRTSL